MNNNTIMIIAGEVSGDIHGANLVREMKKRVPDLEFIGTGGERMRQVGVSLLHDVEEMAVLGFVEVVRKLGTFRAIFRDCVEALETQQPRALILIDYPGFNLRLAKQARKRGIPVHYYISPQVWAWLPGRVKRFKKWIDSMTVIFPFEEDFYKKEGVDVAWVGHPLVDMLDVPQMETTDAVEESGARPDHRVVGLFPGSRVHEIERILPTMLETGKLLLEKDGRLSFVLGLANEGLRPLVERLLTGTGFSVQIIDGHRHGMVRKSDLALVASGTITLEMAFFGVPCIIIYKVSYLTWLIARMLVNVPALGLVNLLAPKPFIPEFIQYDAKPGSIAREAWRILSDGAYRETLCEGLALVKKRLGHSGASAKAAERMIEKIV